MQRQQEADLTGKVAIVTGASRGLGKQIALDLAGAGCNVVLAARTVEPGALPGTLGEAVAQIEALGAGALAVQTDMAKVGDLERLVEAAVARFGGVDILVNNAAATQGEIWGKQFLDLTREDLAYQFEVNAFAPFTLMQLVTPIMAARGGGRIINVTTGCAEALRQPEETPPPVSNGGVNLVMPGYFGSKRALDRMSSVLAPALAEQNIFVISVLPGWVATELMQARMGEDGMKRVQDGDGPKPVPMAVPARMMRYFAACEDPAEYTGRIFFAEREMAALGIATG